MNHDHVRRIRASHDESGPATSLKILGPGHLRSGHQVRSSDPTSEKLSHSGGDRFETFRIWYTTKYQQLVYLRFFLSVT